MTSTRLSPLAEAAPAAKTHNTRMASIFSDEDDFDDVVVLYPFVSADVSWGTASPADAPSSRTKMLGFAKMPPGNRALIERSGDPNSALERG